MHFVLLEGTLVDVIQINYECFIILIFVHVHLLILLWERVEDSMFFLYLNLKAYTLTDCSLNFRPWVLKWGPLGHVGPVHPLGMGLKIRFMQKTLYMKYR